MVSLTKPLTPRQKVAFVMSPRLGDSLLSMVVVHNLLAQQVPIDVFGNYVYALRRWFPKVPIYPFPQEAKCRQVLADYDVLLHAYRKDVLLNAPEWHPCAIVFDESPSYRQRIPMPDIQVAVCREQLYLAKATRNNGIIVPDGLIHRRFPKRVVIHPMSYEEHKNWLPSKFVQLAQQLQKKGYQPEFVVSPTERPDWEWVLAEGLSLPKFASLDEVASWVYESGWMIGNDSGIGHLASNLNIPTLTIGMRTRAMRRWRPSWTLGKVVLPPFWLRTRFLRELLWKRLVSVEQVLEAFEELVVAV
ncbi:MAG: glycosyltransferase family 9 protein [Gammaproteobacteria bacterium]